MRSFKSKFIIYIIPLVCFISLTYLILFIYRSEKILKEQLKKIGISLTKSLAHSAEPAILGWEEILVRPSIDGIYEEEDVVYVVVYHQDGKVFIAEKKWEIVDEIPEEARTAKGPFSRKFHTKQGRLVYDFYSPIIPESLEEEEEVIGFARVGLSPARLIAQTREMFFMGLIVTFFVIGLGGGIAILLAIGITKPVSQLMKGVNAISEGNLDYHIEVKSRDEIGQLASAFNETTKQLRDAQTQLIQSAKMAAVGQLGAGVAHELNNPIAGILGYAQFTLEKCKRPNFGIDDFKTCQRYIEYIKGEATRCKGIVENLLRFSRRPISAKPEPLGIATAIKNILSICGHQLELKNIKVITDLKPDLARVMGIGDQLQQVFTNLILNTLQAMPEEGGELKITAENIIDKETQRPKQIRIEFADTGCGIPEENLPHIFEPFFTTREKEKGTGLGLSVSYQIIQDHKGTISVKSQVDKGAIFTIILPAINEEGIA